MRAGSGCWSCLFFGAANLFEWWIHKNVMHRLVDVVGAALEYMTATSRQHHQYFPMNEMTVGRHPASTESSSFPWRALCQFHSSRCAIRRLRWHEIVKPHAGYILMVIHRRSVPDLPRRSISVVMCMITGVVRNIPLINTIRRHHARITTWES